MLKLKVKWKISCKTYAICNVVNRRGHSGFHHAGSPPTRLVPPAYMILYVNAGSPPAQEVPPRRSKSPRTAPPLTFCYSLTLRPAAPPTRSNPHPHSMSPDRSISHHPSPDVLRPQHPPPYSLTLQPLRLPPAVTSCVYM